MTQKIMEITGLLSSDDVVHIFFYLAVCCAIECFSSVVLLIVFLTLFLQRQSSVEAVTWR